MSTGMLCKTLAFIDLYSQGVELTINGERRSTTILGGVLTIVTVTILLTLFVINGENIYLHINPLISTDTRYSVNSHLIYINRTTFPLSFFMTSNDNEAIIIPEYFKYKVAYFHGKTDEDLIEDELPYEICNSSIHFPLVEEQFDAGGYVNAYCLVNDSLQITGSWSEDYLSYLSIKLFYCDGNDYLKGKVECADITEVQDYIRSGELYFNLVYMDNSLSPNDYKQPINRKTNLQYTSVAVGFTKLMEYYLMPRVLSTDDGLIWAVNKSENVVSIESYSSDFQTFNTDNSENYIAEFTINSSKVSEETKREYTKIQALLADIGGIGNFLMIFFRIVCYKFSIEKRDEAILNKIFDFELTRHKSANPYLQCQRYSGSSANRKKSLLHLQNMFEKSGFIKKRRPFQKTTSMMINQFKQSNVNSTGENMIEDDKASIKMNNKLSIISIAEKNNMVHSFNNPAQVNKLTNSSYTSSIVSSSLMEPEDLPCFTEPDRVVNKEDFLYNLEVENKEKMEKMKQKKIMKQQQKTLNELLKYLDEKSLKNQLHFAFYEVILLFFGKICLCCRCKKFKDKLLLYKRSSYAIREYIDLTFIILKLDEFEKFKFIMLSNDQLAMFNFIGKDIISINQKNQNTSEIHRMKNYNKNKHVLMSHLIMSYQQRKAEESQKKLNDVEEKLFSMLKPEILEICK